MKAQILTQFGAPSVLQYTDVPTPELKPGHALIKVLATSVNPIDCKIRSGAVPYATADFPAILHGDVVGVIEAVANDVKSFTVGDEVFAFGGGVKGTGGALAEYMLVDARTLAKKPTSLSAIEAAALPLVAITAWTALFQKAKLQADQTVLIHGGVGGVGHIAVQFARNCGAKVYTTVLKEQDIALAKSFGAHEVINAKEENTADYVQRLTAGRGFDVVFDTVGGANLDHSLAAAATGSVVVTIAARSTHDLTPLHNKGLSLHANSSLLPLLTGNCEILGETLSQVAELAAQGKVKPRIDEQMFNLAQASEAHALLESGQAKGKVVITVDETL